MSKLDYLNEEIIKEYKAGNNERRVFLQTIKAALINKSKEKPEPMTEEEELNVLKSELKQRIEAAEQYKEAGREDLVGKMENEVKILKEMLPEEMPDEEVRKIIKDKFDELEDKSFGNVMKESMIVLKGKADGSKVSQIVKELIS